jgi:hypothetical protein
MIRIAEKNDSEHTEKLPHFRIAFPPKAGIQFGLWQVF